MKPYNLEVGWNADDLHVASTALKDCKEINNENPIAAAEAMPEIWRTLNDALPIIEAEADRRTEGMQVTEKGVYWNEMRQLKDEIERVIRKATKRE